MLFEKLNKGEDVSNSLCELNKLLDKVLLELLNSGKVKMELNGKPLNVKVKEVMVSRYVVWKDGKVEIRSAAIYGNEGDFTFTEEEYLIDTGNYTEIPVEVAGEEMTLIVPPKIDVEVL